MSLLSGPNLKSITFISAVLIDNVLGQLEEEAVKVCQCPQTSPIVEDLIAMAPLPHLTKLFQILHKDWQVLCTSPAASHILERIITVLPKFISESVADKDIMSSVKNREDENVNDTVKLIRLLMDVSDLMLEDLETVFTHVYYSHVLRTLLQVLGGTRVGESLLKSRTSRERSKEGMKIHMYTVKIYIWQIILRCWRYTNVPIGNTKSTYPLVITSEI